MELPFKDGHRTASLCENSLSDFSTVGLANSNSFYFDSFFSMILRPIKADQKGRSLGAVLTGNILQ